jgi:UDP-N-acetylglucosamine 2-epimerase
MRGLDRVQEGEWSDVLVVVGDTTIGMSRSAGAVERS